MSPGDESGRAPVSWEGIIWAINRAGEAVWDDSRPESENASAAWEITRPDVQEDFLTGVFRYALGRLSPTARAVFAGIFEQWEEGGTTTCDGVARVHGEAHGI